MKIEHISPFHLAGFAFVVALIFTLLIYPEFATPLESTISADGHDRLGFGMYHYGTLSFYPSSEPTVMRGPIYPALIAGSLLFGVSLYPYPLIILQALLHALTVFLTYRIAKELSGSSVQALLAGCILAVHPFPLWYIGRVVIEPLTIALFTLLAFRLLRYCSKPNARQAISLGLVLGIATLTKGTFLIFVLALPILLVLANRTKRKNEITIPDNELGKKLFFSSKTILLIPITSLCLIIPWTLRNYLLTDAIVPVHILEGVNFAVGDHLTEGFTSSPLAYAPIINTFVYPGYPGTGEANKLRKLKASETVRYDRSLRSQSLERYKQDPLFLLKKLGVQTFTFWTLGSQRIVTIIIGGLQLLLLVLTICSARHIFKTSGLFAPRILPLWLIGIYFVAHLPLYAIGRFSVVLVPIMVAYVIGYWHKQHGSHQL